MPVAAGFKKDDRPIKSCISTYIQQSYEYKIEEKIREEEEEKGIYRRTECYITAAAALTSIKTHRRR